MINFVKNLTIYDINSISTISALAYSTDNDPIYYFMQDQTSRNGILEALENEKSDYESDYTDTYNAIIRGSDMFSEDGVIQNADGNLMFLITDGKPDCIESTDPECREDLCELDGTETSDGETLITIIEERNI